MSSAPLTRGSTHSGAYLTRSIVSTAAVAFHAWWSVSEKRWLPAVSALCFAPAALFTFRQWLACRGGTCRIEWEGTHIQILSRGQIDYEGDLSELHRIDRDGRGYFLYPNDDQTVYRLRKGRSNAAFEAALDRIEAVDHFAEEHVR